jgi:acyl carrier protein
MSLTTQQVTTMLLEALNLAEDYEAKDVDPDGQLFGGDGLELDSLDALQLAVAIEENYGLTIDEGAGEAIFQSVRTITDHINAQKSGAVGAAG